MHTEATFCAAAAMLLARPGAAGFGRTSPPVATPLPALEEQCRMAWRTSIACASGRR